MKKYLLVFVMCVADSIVFSQSTQLIIPVKDSIRSQILNETREVWLYVPPKKSGNDLIRYEVLYLLDAEVFFTLVNGLVHLKGQYERSCPEMILVGIPNTDRLRDLTPTHSVISFSGKKDEESLKTSGGGEKFTQFLREELLPYIDKNYSTTSERTFLGHSLAGLLVLNTLVHHPELFDNYVCIDPSVWWDGHKILDQATTALIGEDVLNKKLLFAVSNEKKNRKNAKADNPSEPTRLEKFAAQLTEKGRVKFAWKFYENESHTTVIYPALNEALQMLK